MVVEEEPRQPTSLLMITLSALMDLPGKLCENTTSIKLEFLTNTSTDVESQ